MYLDFWSPNVYNFFRVWFPAWGATSCRKELNKNRSQNWNGWWRSWTAWMIKVGFIFIPSRFRLDHSDIGSAIFDAAHIHTHVHTHTCSCTYSYIHMYILIHSHAHTRTCSCTYSYMLMYILIHAHVHTHTYSCTYSYMLMYILIHARAHTRTCSCTYSYMFMYILIHTHVHTHTYSCTYSYMLMYILIQRSHCLAGVPERVILIQYLGPILLYESIFFVSMVITGHGKSWKLNVRGRVVAL